MTQDQLSPILPKHGRKLSGTKVLSDSCVFTHTPNYTVSLFSSPVKTVSYAFCEGAIRMASLCRLVLAYKKILIFLVGLISGFSAIYLYDGPHQDHIEIMFSYSKISFYWIGLGILSSIGLGTGLHTFVLYLGPHIALVTLAAWDCETIDFPSPPYPNEIICPLDGLYKRTQVSLSLIFSKIYFESFMWGIGTAIGELPPYFMARTARLSSSDNNYYESDAIMEYNSLISDPNENMPLSTKLKLLLIHCVQKAGFWGILVFASIPNPLFDLAGIACGHCLISFKKFFFATLIGKSVIKTSLQVFTVILSFSPHYMDKFFIILKTIPHVGNRIVGLVDKIIQYQHKKFHKKSIINNEKIGVNWLSWGFEKFILLTIIYFIISIINSMANSYIKRYNIVLSQSLNE